MPHDPHTPPQRLLDKYKDKTPSEHVAKYWAMIEWFDETIGALTAHLDKEGLADNTIITYVADNGWIQNPDAVKYAPKSKQSQYDGGLRSPILVRWPAKVKPQKSEALAMSLDFLPTLLKAAGIRAPAGLPGVDLLDEQALQRRPRIHGECFTHNAVDLNVPASNLRWRWLIEGDWKLIVPAPQNEPTAVVELYHLGKDPFEEKNLAEVEKARVTALQQKLDAWWPGKP
jgi:arylsulfatase A-like enzyme